MARDVPKLTKNIQKANVCVIVAAKERGEKVQQYINKVNNTIVEILRVNMFTKGYIGRL
jgi:vacuolar-type H+-ATPase subunit I/STV1